MKQIGNQMKFRCCKGDFPITLCVRAVGMDYFDGKLSCMDVYKGSICDAEDFKENDKVETHCMTVSQDGLVRTANLPCPNVPGASTIYMTFHGNFKNVNDNNPQYLIRLKASTGDKAKTTLYPPNLDPAVATLIFCVGVE